MFTKRNIIFIAICACALLLLTAPWKVFAGEGDDEASWPMDGIWVSTVPTPLGNLVLTTTYVAQDAAKTRYSGSVEEINHLPVLTELYPLGETGKWAGGEVELVGQNKYHGTYLGYTLETVETELGSMEQFVGLWTSDVNFELVDPGTLEGSGNASYYLAEQDADQNGFPDEGQEPVACIAWTWTGKRLKIVPGCELPPSE